MKYLCLAFRDLLEFVEDNFGMVILLLLAVACATNGCNCVCSTERGFSIGVGSTPAQEGK